MTDTTSTDVLCPRCFGGTYAPLTSGRLLCLNEECRHEWDPSDPDRYDDSIAMFPGGGTPAIVLPADADATDIVTQVARARERFVGSDAVVHELEQTGTIVEVDDEGLARVEFGSGYFVWCEPDEFSLIEDDGIPNAVVAAIASTDFAAMAQMLRAGAETIDAQDEAIKLGMAPDGWLPMDGDVMPVIEHGISYLIAWLAITYQIPKQQLLDSADAFEDAARAAGDAQ